MRILRKAGVPDVASPGVSAQGLLFRALGFAAFFLAAAATPGSAFAQGDDHAKAQALVDALSHDAAHASVVGELLARARRQLERANGLRATYDETRARAADGAALEWAETARDVVR